MDEVTKLFCKLLGEQHHYEITRKDDEYLRVVVNYTTVYDIFEEFVFAKTSYSHLYDVYENNKSGYYNHLGLTKIVNVLKSKNIPHVKTIDWVYVENLFGTKGVYKITYAYHAF